MLISNLENEIPCPVILAALFLRGRNFVPECLPASNQMNNFQENRILQTEILNQSYKGVVLKNTES